MLAEDIYDFQHIFKEWNDIRIGKEEVWEVQEFYHVPYHNVILTFRELELLIYQVEKHCKAH